MGEKRGITYWTCAEDLAGTPRLGRWEGHLGGQAGRWVGAGGRDGRGECQRRRRLLGIGNGGCEFDSEEHSAQKGRPAHPRRSARGAERENEWKRRAEAHSLL
jgi:hypothetical protein